MNDRQPASTEGNNPGCGRLFRVLGRSILNHPEARADLGAGLVFQLVGR